MSVKSFSRSSNASSSSRLDDDDPLLKDCIGLRQRLLETEKSLQNLTFSSIATKVSPNTSRVQNSDVDKSLLSDKAPILTLADLTPVASLEDNLLNFEGKANGDIPIPSRMYSSLGEIDTFSNEQNDIQSHSLTQCKHHSDISLLRKKVLSLREENSKLFVQNNKLMGELEKTSYRLQECQSELEEMRIVVNENEEYSRDRKTTAENKQLSEDIKKKNIIIKQLEKMVDELRNRITDNEEIEKRDKEIFKEKLEKQTKKNEDLSLICNQSKTKQEELIKQIEIDQKRYNEQIMVLQKERNDIRDECNKLKGDNFELHEHLNRLKNESLQLQNTSIELNGTKSENVHLKELIETQQSKLKSYSEEVEKTKEHMERLERIIQIFQDEKLTSSRPDSGVSLLSISEPNGLEVDNGGKNSLRAAVADMRLKLAMKDAELVKLKAIVTSNSMLQQKLKSDSNIEGVGIKSLRSELSSIVEQTRVGHVKQMELERTITRLQEELSAKTSQIVELNERMTDKTSLVETLESKLDLRNQKMVDLQKKLESKDQRFENMENELQQTIDTLKNTVSDTRWSLNEKESQLSESKSLVETYLSQINHLENALLAHNEETEATDALVAKIKTLHADHCTELESEILKWQSIGTEKTDSLTKLEKKCDGVMKENVVLTNSVNELKDYISKMEELDEEKKTMVNTYEEKLKVIQHKADRDSQTVLELENSVNKYKSDLQNALSDYEKSQAESQSLVEEKSREIQYLTDDVNLKVNQLVDLENSYKKTLEMLEQSQKHITGLEEAQNKYEKEIARMGLNKSVEVNNCKEQIADLKAMVSHKEKEVELYRGQVNTVNDTLEEAKSKLQGFGEQLKSKDEKILEISKKANHLVCEVKRLKDENVKLENDNSVFSNHRKELEVIVEKREAAFQSSQEKTRALQGKCQSLLKDVQYAKNKINSYESSLRDIETKKIGDAEKIEKSERMLLSNREELKKRDSEIKSLRLQIHEMENLINEQQWKLSQKSAVYTQLEMSCKQDKSELEKKLSQFENDIRYLREDMADKENQLEMSVARFKDLESMYKEKCLACEENSNKLRLQEETNLHASSEVRVLKEELNNVMSKIRKQAEMESEMNHLTAQSQEIHSDMQNLQDQLLTSQQTIIELTGELEDAHSMLSLKEADCTRLARELGASQVREAQEKSRLNQELRKNMEENEFKVSQKIEEIDSIRERNDDLVTSHQQQILKLRLALQRSDDESTLCKNDLERSKQRVRELEENVRKLMKDLQDKQHQCKEMDELLVIRDAEIARHSARISGIERGILTNRSTYRSQEESNSALNHAGHSNTTTTLMRSFKARNELDKLRSQASYRRNSLDELLKRTEAELKEMDLTECSSLQSLQVPDDDGLSVSTLTIL